MNQVWRAQDLKGSIGYHEWRGKRFKGFHCESGMEKRFKGFHCESGMEGHNI